MTDKVSHEVMRASVDIVNQLAIVIKNSQIHDPSNVAVIKSLERYVDIINRLIATGEYVTLELRGEFFYVNETRVKFPMEYMVNFEFIIKEFKKKKLGSITFESETNLKDVQVFLRCLIAAAPSSDSLEAFEVIKESMAEVESISVKILRKIKEDISEVDIRKTVKKTYFNAVSFTKGVLKKIRAGEKINVKRSKRVMQSMVDMILNEEELLLGMTAIKDYDDYTYHHSVNVSILSVSLGQRLGLSRNALLDLGLVALFHDVGKTEIPLEILNKPGAFTDEEWQIMRRHPYWGVKSILKMKVLDDTSIRAAIVAFEHHVHLDHTGYPGVHYQQELDLYSRIVSLSDQYDGMTSARVYARGPMQPDKALSLMATRAGTQLDPLLFKFFVNMVGVYPVGSAVMLDTRELALVQGNNMTLPERPRVLVITDDSGNKLEPFIADLTEKTDVGNYKRSITMSLPPHKYKLNLSEYLL